MVRRLPAVTSLLPRPAQGRCTWRSSTAPPRRVQAEVLRLVDECGADGSTRRLIVGTETDLCELAAAGRFLPELAYVASALPIELAPLRDRPDDVPALVETITQDLRARLRLEAVTYRPAALERLRHYLWFGNVAELEAVLTRTLTLHRPSVVEAEQLVFLPEAAAEAVAERTTATPAVGPPTVAPLGSTGALVGLDLEVVLGELAHELRNPMVTIKTVAQHLDGVLADPEARARFSVLMAEAVGRMDGLLETLLDFARFRAPLAQSVDVEKVLDRVLAEHAEDLGRRHVRVERNGSGIGIVRADEAQVSFALRSLLSRPHTRPRAAHGARGPRRGAGCPGDAGSGRPVGRRAIDGVGRAAREWRDRDAAARVGARGRATRTQRRCAHGAQRRGGDDGDTRHVDGTTEVTTAV